MKILLRNIIVVNKKALFKKKDKKSPRCLVGYARQTDPTQKLFWLQIIYKGLLFNYPVHNYMNYLPRGKELKKKKVSPILCPWLGPRFARFESEMPL